MNRSPRGLTVRAVCAAALAAAAFATPALAAAPWSTPDHVADAPQASPQVVLSGGGNGVIVWAPAFFDPAVGQELLGARIFGGRVGPPEVLRQSYFGFTQAAALNGDEFVVAGTSARRGVRRAAVAFGSTSRTPLLGRTRTLPGATPNSTPVALATNSRGAAAVAYSRCADRRCKVRELAFVVRPRDGAFGRAVRLGRIGARLGPSLATGVAVALNARGDTLAAWENDGEIRTRLRTAAGRAGRVERIGRGSLAEVSAALGEDRTALVAWGAQRFVAVAPVERFAVYGSFRPPRERFGPARLLERHAQTRFANAAAVRATITERRTSVVYQGEEDGRFAVRSRDVTSGSFGPPQTLSATDDDARLIDVATLAAGDQVAIWKTGANVAIGPGALVAATRPPAISAFGGPETIDPNVPLAISDVEINPITGEPWATWSSDRSIFVCVRSAIGR